VALGKKFPRNDRAAVGEALGTDDRGPAQWRSGAYGPARLLDRKPRGFGFRFEIFGFMFASCAVRRSNEPVASLT
jgi:hypothetical protein